MSLWRLFFSYVDKKGDAELWEVDGTRIFEVTPGVSLSSPQAGLDPESIDAYDGKVIFAGFGGTLNAGLWLSNGAKSGTHAIKPIKNADPNGLSPHFMTTYKGEVLFAGATPYDGPPTVALWVTKGTPASTAMLGGSHNNGIKFANHTAGLLSHSGGFTLFSGALYFAGDDAAGDVGLWRTNGTIKGTYELGPINGAFGSNYYNDHGTSMIDPRYLCAVGKKLFFEGSDTDIEQQGSLWATNGTVKGTYEVGGEGDEGVKGAPGGNRANYALGLAPTDIVDFRGKALFMGLDDTVGLSGVYNETEGLWLSNGTAKGTIEIGGRGSATIKGANPLTSGGLFARDANPDFTVYKNEALFLGVGSKNEASWETLWVTNGTAKGTHEIGSPDSVGVAGKPVFASNDINPPDFTVYDGKVFFEAESLNASTHAEDWGIWETDGTAKGTHLLLDIGKNYNPLTDFTVAKL